jgi:hypothetical protein
MPPGRRRIRWMKTRKRDIVFVMTRIDDLSPGQYRTPCILQR